MKVKKGLLMVFTGNGKGKTTAALGLALRAMGHGLKICVIQFIKGAWTYGELASVKRFSDLMDFHVTGRGFTWKSNDITKDQKAAQDAWQFARQKMTSGKYDMVILDELTYLLKLEAVSEKDMVDILSGKAEDLHVVVTGRSAPQSLIDLADLVSDVQAVKHPYQSGIKAQKGIEF